MELQTPIPVYTSLAGEQIASLILPPLLIIIEVDRERLFLQEGCGKTQTSQFPTLAIIERCSFNYFITMFFNKLFQPSFSRWDADNKLIA